MPTVALPGAISPPIPSSNLSQSIISPLKRHRALWHAAHSILTSYIPWNTSSPASLLVVPGYQTRPDHPLHLFSHTPSFLHPPTPGLISRHQWLPLSIGQSLSLSELFHLASLPFASDQIVPAVWSVQGRRTTPTRTLINPAERGHHPPRPWETWGGKRKRFWW